MTSRLHFWIHVAAAGLWVVIGIWAYHAGLAQGEDQCAISSASSALEHQKALNDANVAAQRRYQALVEEDRAADAQLVKLRAELEAERRRVKQRIRDVSTQYVPVPDASAVPVPRCVFTRGWLLDYNAALGLRGGENESAATASGPGVPPGPAPAADAGLLQDSGLTQADVLAHVADYGAWCQGRDRQADALIERQGAR